MKILACSDLHGHNHRAFATYEDGMNSRLRESLAILREVKAAAADCDLVLFGGDMFHVTPPPAVVFNLIYDAFLGITTEAPVMAIAGNHDLLSKRFRGDDREIPFLKFALIPNFTIFGVGSTPSVQKCGDLTVFGLHSSSTEDAKKAIAEAAPADIAIFHQEVQDAKIGKFVFPSGITPNVTEKFKWTLCGHIHEPQRMSDHFLVMGSMSHLNFSDTGDRGFWILDTEKDTIEMVKTTFSKFVTVTKPEEVLEDGNNYRVALTESEKKISLPGSDDAVVEYVKACEAPEEYVKAGRDIAKTVICDPIIPSQYQLEEIAIRNFTVFEEAAVDVEKGLCLVLGEYDGREGKSNGSGKTSLFEAVCWALYGLTSKGERGAAVLRRGVENGEKCTVHLTLRRENDVLEIHRVQSKSGMKLTFTENGKVTEGDSRVVQKDLVAALGVSYDFFRQMVYFSQESVDFFASMGDAGKKDMLASLLNLEWYQAAHEIAKAKLSAATELADEAKSSILAKVSSIEQAEKELDQFDTDISEWDGKQAGRLEDFRSSIDQLDVDRKARQEALETTTEASEAAGDVQAELEAMEATLEPSKKALEDVASDIRRINSEARSECARIDSDISRVASDISGVAGDIGRAEGDVRASKRAISKAQDKIASIMNLRDGEICVVCGSPVTPENKAACCQPLADDISAANKEGGAHLETVKKHEARRKEFEARRKELKESRVVGERNTETLIAEQEAKSKEVRHTRDVIEGKIILLREKDRRARDLVAQCKTLRSTIEILQGQIDDKETQYMVMKDELCPLRGTRMLKEDLIKSLKGNLELSQGTLKMATAAEERFKFWVKGFGRQGIPALVLDDFCVTFSREVNDILVGMGIGISVELSAFKTLKSGERREQLSYIIRTPTGESSYKLLSGGEKVRVDLVSMLALNQIASRQFNVQNGLFGLLVLDEVFSSLDSEGCELLFEILCRFQARSIFVISHKNSLKPLFDTILTVKKTGHTSVIE